MNERFITSIEGTANVLLDKAAAAEKPEDTMTYMKAFSIATESMCKLEDKDLAEEKLAYDQSAIETRNNLEAKRLAHEEEISFWDRENLTRRDVLNEVGGVIKSGLIMLGSVIGGVASYKAIKMQNTTTLKAIDAVTEYQQSNVLNTKTLDVVDRSQKIVK